jgi:Lysophospholipase
MRMQNFYQKMSDGAEISVNRWLPDEGREIRGIVQLNHGMVEHAVRYDRLGSVLAENGWVFSAHDMRGHGKTAQKAEADGTGMFGMIAEKKGFDRAVSDLNEVITRCRNDFPDKKLILLGHSFGSFIAQSYLETYGGSIDACVLSGTAGPRRMTMFAGKMVARSIALFKGKKHVSSVLHTMAFGSYTKRIPGAVNGQEWLSRNEENVRLYLNDKWCGFNPTVSFYIDMMTGLGKVHDTSNMKKIPRNIPVLFIYGSDDPVGGYGKTVQKLASLYRKNGMTDVTVREYPQDRHELFNETDRDRVTDDFLAWINGIL